jgi:hypothetical protein
MKHFSIAVLTFLTVVSCSSAAPTSLNPEQQVRRINSDFFLSINNLNIERFDQIVADDAIFAGANRTPGTKKNVRDALVMEKKNLHTRIIVRNVRVTATKIYSDTAVVIGLLWAPRKDSNGHREFINTFARTESNQWKLIASGHYEVPKTY